MLINLLILEKEIPDLTLDDLYEEGLYVFGGWHELLAHRELHKLFPHQDPEFRFAQHCTIYVFGQMTTEMVDMIRIVGAAQNKYEATRQIPTIWDNIMDARRYMIVMRRETGDPRAKLSTEKKVIFVFILFVSFGCFFFVYFLFVYFFCFRKSWP